MIGSFEECRRAFLPFAEVELAVAKEFCVEIHFKYEVSDEQIEVIEKAVRHRTTNMMWVDRRLVVVTYPPLP